MTVLQDDFSFEARMPAGLTSAQLLETILQERPDLRGQQTYFPEQGVRSRAVIIGDEVFKAARLAGDAGAFKREIDILSAVQELDTPLPKLTTVGRDNGFYGMERVKGVSVDAVLPQMTDREQDELGKQIAEFSVRLARGLPVDSACLLAHLDMHPGNVFVDPISKKLTGIIDAGGIEPIPNHAVSICICVNDRIRHSFLREFTRRWQQGTPPLSPAHGAGSRATP